VPCSLDRAERGLALDIRTLPLPAYALKQGATEAMQDYLTWEVGPMAQVNNDSDQ